MIAAGLPFLAPEAYRLPLLVGLAFVFFALGSITSCAFNSWTRDLIPEDILSRFLAKRMTLSMAVGVALSLVAAVSIDYYKSIFSNEAEAFSIIFGIGALAGFIGVGVLSRIPEPKLPPVAHRRLSEILKEPLQDSNYRQLLVYLGAWSFAVNFAAPFFTVYMLSRLNMGMTVVLGLTTFSQIINVMFFRIWGRLADRYSNKSVLAVSGPMFMLSVLLWPFTTLPESYTLTIPLLMFIHALAGIGTAGVTLCTGGIALKSAPRGRATAYLATNSLVSGTAATFAPLIAGMAADGFKTQELGITFHWVSKIHDYHEISMAALNFQGLDFLFLASFIFGLYALHRLIGVQEVGEVKERIVLSEFYGEIRRVVRNVSSVAGLRHLTHFPYTLLLKSMNRRKSKSDPK